MKTHLIFFIKANEFCRFSFFHPTTRVQKRKPKDRAISNNFTNNWRSKSQNKLRSLGVIFF